jgi:hypothetical protein
MRNAVIMGLAIAVAAALGAHAVFAQHPGAPPVPGSGGSMPAPSMPHTGPMAHMAPDNARTPAMPGQDAFGAIAEVVRLLDADPTTDWSRVDLERLRQHLIDMNEVVLRSAVKQTRVDGGLAMEITGTGRTEQAIRAMVVPHAAELDRLPAYHATAEVILGGVRLTVRTKKADDAGALARLRGLGFAGLLTEGAHHALHHVAMARGQAFGHTH